MNLNSAIAKIHDRLDNIGFPDHNIQLELGKVVNVDCDVINLEQMMSHLVINSVASNGTCVKIRTQDNKVHIIDNGTGIPESIKNMVFKKGFSTKGTPGNGLYITRQLARKNKAKVNFIRINGETIFTIILNWK